jgi:hypothetical protein
VEKTAITSLDPRRASAVSPHESFLFTVDVSLVMMRHTSFKHLDANSIAALALCAVWLQLVSLGVKTIPHLTVWLNESRSLFRPERGNRAFCFDQKEEAL